jgi:hypothetical protein
MIRIAIYLDVYILIIKFPFNNKGKDRPKYGLSFLYNMKKNIEHKE